MVLGIVFGALAVYCLRAVWRAGIDGRDGRAIALGIVGGIAAIVAAGCLAGAIILFLLAAVAGLTPRGVAGSAEPSARLGPAAVRAPIV